MKINTTVFIITPEFDRLTKLSFNPRMKKARKSLTIRSNVTTTLDLAEEKIKQWKGSDVYLRFFY